MYNSKQYDTINARCTTAINLYAISGNLSLVNDTAFNFNNIRDLIVSCPCWNELSGNYLMYKITGITVSISPVHDGSDLVNGAISVPAYIGIFPTSTNAIKTLSEIIDKDDSIKVCPSTDNIRDQYWNFPDGYLESTNGGLGVWVSIQSIYTQLGQICFTNYSLGGAFSNTKLLYQVQYDIHVSFRGRRT